jgi:hypothetical protein
MNITQSAFTIAEVCNQMDRDEVTVNREYQRSGGVWPSPARSFLIDTILSGFPIPKFIFYQKTNLSSRTTIKEIVDGQQRISAIKDFFDGKLKISGKGSWAGNTFDSLAEEDQQKFLDYSISSDVFVAADESEIRQVFQRMNSYQVPLNRQEQRHATYQGELKWFIFDLTVRYSEILKRFGVISERQFVRMVDAALFTELLYALEHGLESTSDSKLDKFYEEHDEEFDTKKATKMIIAVFASLISRENLLQGQLSKTYHFYTLFLAIAHVIHGPVPALQLVYNVTGKKKLPSEQQAFRLSQLAGALDEPELHPRYKSFIEASSEGSNRINQRRTRFKWMCAALLDVRNPR